VIPATRHVPADCVDPRIKQRSRLHWWLADREAHDREPGAIALLLGLDGHVTETAGANFLAILDGVVCSPPRRTILEGISLRVVEGLCGELGIAFAERPLSREACLGASEALLTSTPYCVAGVAGLDGQALAWPGPVLGRLLALWGEKVGVDIARQILPDR
jgi:branched-subunit amino acid aminotransferase/4-amino-4-deoxychorismate lyase